MQDRDWTGTAAAVTALALMAGAWLWPDDATQRTTPPTGARTFADNRAAEDMAELVRWRTEARRWDGSGDAVQLSAAAGGEAGPAVIR